MKSVEFKPFGITVSCQEPETAEEFDSLAKLEGACVKEASANIRYRSWNPDFKDKFLPKVEEETGNARKTKETGAVKKSEDGSEEPILTWGESEAVYFKRVCAETSRSPESFQALAQECADATPFDPSQKERAAAGPGKFSNMVKKTAKDIMDSGKIEAAAAYIKDTSGVIMGELAGNVEDDLLVIAAAVKANEKFLSEQARAAYTA